MPKFICSYGHDIGCFADFVVDAATEADALRQIQKALREGKFEGVDTMPAWENGPTHQRVFVQGVASESSGLTTLVDLAQGDKCVRKIKHSTRKEA